MYAGFQLGNLQQLFQQDIEAFDAFDGVLVGIQHFRHGHAGRRAVRSAPTMRVNGVRRLCAMVSEMCLALFIKSSILSSIALTSRLSRVNSSSPVDAEMRLRAGRRQFAASSAGYG